MVRNKQKINITNDKKYRKMFVKTNRMKIMPTRLLMILCLLTSSMHAQNVAISPSRLYFKTPIGEYKVQEVSVTNSATSAQSFAVTFGDFEPSGTMGKSQIMKPGESANSCSQWLSAEPSFFELAAGQTQKVKVLMQVPSTPEANKVKWAAMQIKLAKEKKAADLDDKNAIGLGITETFQFVVHIFQSPPTVTVKNAEIESFSELTTEKDTTRMMVLRVKNSGEAILDCVSYLEYTNLSSGEESRQKPVAYTLLPGTARELKFPISSAMPEGKYSLLGVVDYGSRENVQAAETEVTIKR
jgi:P pilus assembly chaperone PapD